MTLTAIEILEKMDIHRCPECKCALGDDWDFLDFSNKSLIECPQCKEVIAIDEERLMRANPSPSDISNVVRHLMKLVDETPAVDAIAGRPLDKPLANRCLNYLSANLDDIAEALHD